MSMPSTSTSRPLFRALRPHLELEAALSQRLGTEAAITYSAGVTTVSSVIPALVQPGDRVVVDAEVHLGFRAGLRLTKAEARGMVLERR